MTTLHNRQRWQTRHTPGADDTDADMGVSRDDLASAAGIVRAVVWALLLWAAGAGALAFVLGR